LKLFPFHSKAAQSTVNTSSRFIAAIDTTSFFYSKQTEVHRLDPIDATSDHQVICPTTFPMHGADDLITYMTSGNHCNAIHLSRHQVSQHQVITVMTRRQTTKGPMWGYPVPVLGAISPFLEPFRGRLSPNIDNVSEKLTLRYPHEGPWVV
jgi:hypothetical protein